MPRKARIDAPGALHHIMVRGIERRNIFDDDIDRINFLDRLGKVLSETDTQCFSWALIPNHFHLLLRTGACPISTVMRRLLTGHAMNYNRRHRRNGQLFQNRYKSILRLRDVRGCGTFVQNVYSVTAFSFLIAIKMTPSLAGRKCCKATSR